MAAINMPDLQGLAVDFKELAGMPAALQDEMLLAQGTVVMEAQRKAGRALKVEDTGMTLNSISLTQVKLSKKGRCVDVTFDGARTRTKTQTRNAEIAFINEFGKQGQRARPFVATGNEQSADKATQAAFNIYDKYLKDHNL